MSSVPGLPRLVLLHGSRSLGERLARGTAGRFLMQRVDSWTALASCVGAAPSLATVVVVDPYEGAEPGSGPALQLHAFLAGHLSTTVIAAVEARPDRLDDLRLLGQWGVAAIAASDPVAVKMAIEAGRASARPHAVRRLFERLLHERHPERARLLDTSLEVVAAGGGTREIARALHLSSRSLQRRFDRAGLSPPESVVTCIRVLTAAELLLGGAGRIGEVAFVCGYRSDSALRAATKQLLGLTPGEIRGASGLDEALAGCVMMLARGHAER